MGASYLERAGQTAARQPVTPESIGRDIGMSIAAGFARLDSIMAAAATGLQKSLMRLSGMHHDDEYADAMLAEHRAAMKRQPRHRRSLADGGYVVGAPVVMAGGPCGPFGGPGPAAGASSVLIEGIRRRDLMRSVR